MSDLSIDIVTVTRNDLDGLSRTLRSARFARTLADERGIALCHHVIDSSDSDITVRVESLVEREPGNCVYVFQPPSDISAAFNQGIELSQAEWVWMLNGGTNSCQTHPLLLFSRLLIRQVPSLDRSAAGHPRSSDSGLSKAAKTRL